MRMLLTLVLATCLLAPSARAAPNFGAPLPKECELLQTSQEKDEHGQAVEVLVFRTSQSFRSLKRFYKRRMKRRLKQRLVRIAERRESVRPGYIPDPADPKSSTPVFRVLNFDFSSSWAAIFVRPLSEGAVIAVRERKEPPEVDGEDNRPKGFEIPRSLFQQKLRDLQRD